MKFVDLNTGCVYNGNIPYIHWFDDKQSTSLIYIKKLCIIDAREFLNVNLDSSIFTLLNMDDVENLQDINVNDFSYKDIKKLRTKNYKSTGHYYNIDQNNIYIHVIAIYFYEFTRMVYKQFFLTTHCYFIPDFHNNQKCS